MPSFNKRHTITRSQLNERAAKRKRRPGKLVQRKGIKPISHQLPDKPVWKPIVTPQVEVDRAVAAEFAKRKSAPSKDTVITKKEED